MKLVSHEKIQESNKKLKTMVMKKCGRVRVKYQSR